LNTGFGGNDFILTGLSTMVLPHEFVMVKRTIASNPIAPQVTDPLFPEGTIVPADAGMTDHA
jgi:hypothetical protein